MDINISKDGAVKLLTINYSGGSVSFWTSRADREALRDCLELALCMEDIESHREEDIYAESHANPPAAMEVPCE